LNRHYHPYFSPICNNAVFKLIYEPDPSKLTITSVKQQNLEIGFSPKYSDPRDIIKTHNELFDIEGIYNRHQDIAEELLIKAVIYTNGLIDNHLKIKDLFADKNEYYRYLLGNYHLQEDTLKRPLSKFTQDIAKQLGLIK
jgi:hypothetical protein